MSGVGGKIARAHSIRPVGFIDWLDANDVKITLPVSKQIVGFDFVRSQIRTFSVGALKLPAVAPDRPSPAS
jgi:hypothetical protein